MNPLGNRWASFNWVDWDFRTNKAVRPEVRKLVEEHRPPHEVQQRMGTFGVEEVKCMTCGKSVWNIEATTQIDVY